MDEYVNEIVPIVPADDFSPHKVEEYANILCGKRADIIKQDAMGEPPVITTPAKPDPVLASDYQVVNRWSFNFITPKTSAGYKCISLPAVAPRDVLLAAAIEEFKRWEARVG